ncbi:MAG: long-chain fatty acid--CoA ligase [Ardenticatenales bacterium]|nr:long-chain fatty acid--CoA ligase [Ardenticatenales bacterium]
MLNLATILESSAAQYPNKPVIIMGDMSMTYAQLNGAANQVATALAKVGVGRGDRVAIMLPNVPYFPLAYFGILKTGATVVPLNVLLKGREVTYHLNDSQAKVLIAFDMFAEDAKRGFEESDTCEHLWIATTNPAGDSPVSGENITTLGRAMHGNPPTFDNIQTMPDDTAVILYTSGTTGQPKGAELTHFNMFFNALYAADKLVQVTPDDVFMAVLPLFHSFGQTCVMNAGIYGGVTITMLPRFEPDKALAIMARDGATLFAGVPTMYWALLNTPGKEQFIEPIRKTLRLCSSGGSAMPVELMRQFEETFGVTILEGFGLSETSPVATFNTSKEARKPGSIGTAIWGTEVKIFDEHDREVPRGERGEIVIRGHNVMKGYLGRPEATAECMRNGWFHSGDIGYMDEDDYIFIVDRKKDMILRGGFNVYPRELEEVLMMHPAVSLVAVVGVSDEKLGEEIKAYIVRKPDISVTEDELSAWCQENMAAYKYPRFIEFRDELPMTATGKILKRELR